MLINELFFYKDKGLINSHMEETSMKINHSLFITVINCGSLDEWSSRCVLTFHPLMLIS